MDNIEIIKNRLKCKRRNKVYSNFSSDEERIKKINNFVSRVLIGFIIFLMCVIVMNVNGDVKSFVKNDILGNNMSFTKISNIYNKYFGKVIPINESGIDDKTVFNEKLEYSDLKDYKDGYELNVKNNYVVPNIKSGIVVFIGEKEGYGNTIIVQGIDEIEYWYGNIENINVSLYDYISNGSVIGNVKGDKMYLVFQKDGKYLGYDEVME